MTHIERQAVLKRFLVTFLPAALVVAGITVLLFVVDYGGRKALVETETLHNIHFLRGIVAAELRSAVSDLAFLSGQNELGDCLMERSALDCGRLAREFRVFSDAKGVYDQIRLIDAGGMEVVRVDRGGDGATVVPAGKLQDKSGRYYFQETIRLGRGEVFVSQFDLNVENGVIEVPLKPVIRFASPVFDGRGRVQGMVVLNYLGKELLSRLDAASSMGPGRTLLLNEEGYYLRGIRPEDEWGFMYDDRRERTFARDFPSAWKTVSSSEAGQFLDGGRLFTFTTVFPVRDSTGAEKALPVDAAAGKQMGWKLVSVVPAGPSGVGMRVMIDYLFPATALVFFLGVSLWYIAGAGVSRKMAEEEIRRSKEELEVRVRERTEALRVLNRNLRERTERLASLLRVMDGMNQELVASNRCKAVFLASVSHELKTPLNHILGFTELMKLNSCDEMTQSCREYVDNICKSGRELLKLIDYVLEVSRGTPGMVDVEEFDLEELFTEVLGPLKPGISEKRLDMQVYNTVAGGRIRLDRDMLKQILTSLLDNAVKFTPAGGTVSVEAGLPKENGRQVLRIRVSDTGPGIREEDKERIFDPFETGGDRGMVAGAEGIGIGLAIARMYAEFLGGYISVESEAGKGATFELILPLGAHGEAAGRSDTSL